MTSLLESRLFENIFISDASCVLFLTSIIVISLYSFSLLVRKIVINDKVEKLILLREKEIEDTKFSGMTETVFNAKKEAITKKYDTSIAPLLRKKAYISDVLPFIQKR